MAAFTLETEHWLPRQPGDIFDFYADAFNLEKLTPPWLRFEVVTPAPITMRAGVEIDYRLRLHGVSLKWRSRITHWDPPHRFVDEQDPRPLSNVGPPTHVHRLTRAAPWSATTCTTTCSEASWPTACWFAAI